MTIAEGSNDEGCGAADAAGPEDRRAAQAGCQRAVRGDRPAVRHRRGADARLDGRRGAAPHADDGPLHLLVAQPPGVLGQGRYLRPPAVGQVGRAGLRRRRRLGHVGQGGCPLQHRRPDVLGHRRPGAGDRRRASRGLTLMSSKREYGLALLAGAVGGGLILVSVRQRWAQAVFTPPKPLSAQTISVTGADLVPLAGALGIAALAGLAAVIATRGVMRRASGVLLAAFGIGAAVAAGVA